jgi:two-component system sensor histidine kinase KdpD
MAMRGVLAVVPVGAPLPDDPDDRRLLDACCSTIGLTLERIHFMEVAQETLVRWRVRSSATRCCRPYRTTSRRR